MPTLFDCLTVMEHHRRVYQSEIEGSIDISNWDDVIFAWYVVGVITLHQYYVLRDVIHLDHWLDSPNNLAAQYKNRYDDPLFPSEESI